MKTFLATLLVLFLSVPTAMAGSIDGKGIWCDRPGNEFGYWFNDGGYYKHSIEGHTVVIHHRPPRGYEEVGTEELKLDMSSLNRKTLQITLRNEIPNLTYQCYLVSSRQALDATLQSLIDAAKAENKL